MSFPVGFGYPPSLGPNRVLSIADIIRIMYRIRTKEK